MPSCSTTGTAVGARWVGTMIPQPDSSCGNNLSSTLTRRGTQFTFAPGDGVLVITGSIASDGHVHSVLPLIGANKQPFPLTIEGTLTPSGFSGTYSTPRCKALVQLQPASS